VREKSQTINKNSKHKRFVSIYPGPLLPLPEAVHDCLQAGEGEEKEFYFKATY
jgi:hypothetical protein